MLSDQNLHATVDDNAILKGLTLEVPAAARWVLLDPRLLRIERNRRDNLRPIP